MESGSRDAESYIDPKEPARSDLPSSPRGGLGRAPLGLDERPSRTLTKASCRRVAAATLLAIILPGLHSYPRAIVRGAGSARPLRDTLLLWVRGPPHPHLGHGVRRRRWSIGTPRRMPRFGAAHK